MGVVKKTLFQLHWLFGITAGLVLALMGTTGAIWSFQEELLRLFNPQALSVEQREGSVLAPAELVQRVEAEQGEKVAMLWVDVRGEQVARVWFTPPPGKHRGQLRYADPYTGVLKGEVAGQDFFDLMLRLHRFLAMGDIGQQITGACTLMLIFFCLSGLYLRWPRKALNWRTWLTFDWRKKGRAFNWDLHAVAGTWCLLFYLLFALTGLTWSYEWYRDGMRSLFGYTPAVTELSARQNMSKAASEVRTVNYEAIWTQLQNAAGPSLTTYNLRLSAKATEPASVRYLSQESGHERAFDILLLDPTTGHVLQHDRYAEKSVSNQLLQSIYALHVGSYFGLPGRIILTVASLSMPLFFITGWLLYLDRRRKQHQTRAARGAVDSQSSSSDSWLIGFASQSGFAEQLAWQSAGQLQGAGLPVQVRALAELEEHDLRTARRALFVVSTFGDGEAPDSARGFERRAIGQAWSLAHLDYALLALGDRQYPHFCGFARRLQAWLGERGATTTFSPIEVDNADPAALQAWQQALAQLTGAQPVAAWQPPSFGQWRLVKRALLNPGSQGLPVYMLGLASDHPVSWEAGDLVEILPLNNPARTQAFVSGLGIDPATPVHIEGLQMPFEQALSGRQLPNTREHLVGLHAQALLDALAPLGSREYSIASIASDGVLELIVRQERHPDGNLGLGSGWLTEYLPLHGQLNLRVRRNSGFHLPRVPVPLILIGSGTGLAGLRSLLRAQLSAGERRNWLLFGERNRACDLLCGTELQHWVDNGELTRLDLAFSRDQAEKIYVQDVLLQHAEECRGWIDEGAAVYVCGSLQGMAAGVHAALEAILGGETLQQLIEEGRYRRDVY